MRGTLRMPKAMRDTIERTVGIRQFLGVGLFKGNNVVLSALTCALGTDVEHLGIDVADGDAHARAAGFHHAEGDVAGAAGQIEQGKALVGTRRIDRRHQRILPGAVQAGRHQVVHQVIAAGHRMEHVIDQRLLVGKRHRLFAEMGLSAVFSRALAMTNSPLPAGP